MIQVKYNNAWTDVKEIWVKDTIWKKAKKVYVKTDNTWNEVYTSSIGDLGDSIEGGYYYYNDGTYAYICSTDSTEKNWSDAIQWCDDKSDGGYNDWFLPNKDQLNDLYNNASYAYITSSVTYWSSTEDDSTNAWCQSFSSGDQFSSDKSYSKKVYAIRKVEV